MASQDVVEEVYGIRNAEALVRSLGAQGIIQSDECDELLETISTCGESASEAWRAVTALASLVGGGSSPLFGKCAAAEVVRSLGEQNIIQEHESDKILGIISVNSDSSSPCWHAFNTLAIAVGGNTNQT